MKWPVQLLLGAFLFGLFLAAALLSLVWTPYDVAALNIASKLAPPSAAHWLGTDHLGRDILLRILYGSRVSLLVGVTVVGIGMSLGIVLGLLVLQHRLTINDVLDHLAAAYLDLDGHPLVAGVHFAGAVSAMPLQQSTIHDNVRAGRTKVSGGSVLFAT